MVKKNSVEYFIRYNNDDVNRLLYIRLTQMIGYVNKTMPFKVTDNKLVKECNKIWERVSNLLSIKFDSEPVYGDNDKYIKNKNKSIWRQKKYNFSRQKKYQTKTHHISAYH